MRIPTLLLLAATVACASTDETPADTASSDIYGGTVSTFQASVLLTQAGSPQCSGTLIAPRVVMASASCEKFFTGVVVGWSEPLGPHGYAKVRAPDSHLYAPRRVAVHPSFRGVFQGVPGCPARPFDVMLVELDRPVTGIEPAPLPTAPPRVGEQCRVIGFGMHGIDGDTVPSPNGNEETVGERREVSVRIESLEGHRARVSFAGGTTSRGDLGATLLCSGGVVTGVVGTCGGPYTGDVVIRTDAVRAFIEETVKSWGMALPQ